MIQKLKMLILAFSSLFILATPALAFAGTDDTTQNNINTNLCGGSNLDLTGSSTCPDESSSLSSKISNIINIFSAVIGIVAVVMIIVAGFRYITSGGKQESVSGAKNTILYAIIGLVIVAFAQIIVHFVINKTTS